MVRNYRKKIPLLVRSGILSYTFFMTKYVMFDHTADIGVEIFGRTKKELFANAAWAVKDILFDPLGPGPERRLRKKITVEGADVADLLVNFLREILYLFNGGAWIVLKSEVTECSNKKLKAKLILEPYDQKKYFLKTEIKAVTYHEANAVRDKSGWKARVIFDV